MDSKKLPTTSQDCPNALGLATPRWLPFNMGFHDLDAVGDNKYGQLRCFDYVSRDAMLAAGAQEGVWSTFPEQEGRYLWEYLHDADGLCVDVRNGWELGAAPPDADIYAPMIERAGDSDLRPAPTVTDE